MAGSLFELRGELSKSQSLMLTVVGIIIFVVFWWILAEVFSVERPIVEDFHDRLPSQSELGDKYQSHIDSLTRLDSIAYANATEFEKVYPILPPPTEVLQAFNPLYNKDRIVYHSLKSIWLNIQGYIWAILIAIPIGFVIGLFPLFRGLFSKQVDAMRYLPLTALTGLFIIWFGIEDQMKIAFLAFGIIVYLLPVVAQRVNEVKDVYTKTVRTIGATKWQTIKSVFIPSVMSKVMDDIRVLTAISWTYIIIAELLNRQDGIGALIYLKARQGQIEKVFAILIIIILIGFLQDRIFVYLDRRLFPHKIHSRVLGGVKESRYGIWTLLFFVVAIVLLGAFVTLPEFVFSSALPIILFTTLLAIGYGEYLLYKSKKVNG